MITLSGCDNNLHVSPMGLQRDGNALRVAVCGEEFDIDRVFASYQNENRSIRWQRFFDAKGRAVLAENQEIALTREIGFGLEVVTSDQPQLAGGSEVLVTVVAATSGETRSAEFKLDEDLKDGVWLQNDGTVTTSACPAN